MKALVFSTALVLTLSTQAPIAPPSGYRLPTEADYFGHWQAYRDKLPRPFTVRADFNGDGLQDEAWVLPATSPTGWGLFAFLGAPAGQRRVVLLDSHAKERVQRYGVSLVAPGQHRTQSPGGVPGVLDLKSPAINFFIFESANAIYWWDRQAGSFQQTWITDEPERK